jgi:ABC-type transporter Mla MlaB component
MQIVLEGTIDITGATELKSKLVDALDDSSTIEINASGVDRIDTAGLQLLLSFVNHLKDIQRNHSWIAPAECLVNAALLLGIKDALELEG